MRLRCSVGYPPCPFGIDVTEPSAGDQLRDHEREHAEYLRDQRAAELLQREREGQREYRRPYVIR